MLAFLTGLSLRIKLYALAVGGVLVTLGYLWLRWQIAARKAKSATAKAEQLEATHNLEVRIAAKRAKLRERQAKIRSQIDGDASHFEQGWGP